MAFLKTRVTAVLSAIVLLLAGCGGEDASPSDSGSSPGASASATNTSAEVIDVTIKGDEVTPVAEKVNVGLGQPVKLKVTSDRAAELHVHSDPEHEFEVKPGKHTYAFTLDTPGVVDVEEHESDSLVLRIVVE